MEFNFKSYDNSNQSISYCEVDKCKAVVDLKQQLAQLKEQLEAYKMEAEEGKEINAELKAENERLKKEIRLYDCIDKWGTEQCRCACRCLGNEFCNDADKKINKYKQVLIEIKNAIGDRNKEGEAFCDDRLYKIEQILQICDEVTNENKC